MCSNTEVLYFGDGLSPQDQKCLLGPVLLSSFKWVLHNMEVISKKYWAFAFKKKRKVQQKTSSLFFLLILSMLWDENHYDKSPFWFIVLFFNHQTSAPFRFSFTSILYIYIYVWLICFFNHQSFIAKWKVHSREQTYRTGDICDAMGELHEHVPASGKKQDRRFLDWPHGHPNKGLGLIYLAFCWDDTCRYGFLIPICKSYSANWTNPNPRGFVMSPTRSSFVSMSFHVTGLVIFLSWAFPRFSLSCVWEFWEGQEKITKKWWWNSSLLLQDFPVEIWRKILFL